MALTVKVYNESFPDDVVFGIVGLGAFTNGEAREVTEEEERSFVGFYQQSVEDQFAGAKNVEVSGTSTIDNLDDVLGVDVNDTPSKDPTAMNLDADGNIFADNNINGVVSDPEVVEVVEEEEAPAATHTTPQLDNTPQTDNGGDNT